jgi:hypothetical protein
MQKQRTNFLADGEMNRPATQTLETWPNAKYSGQE